MFKLKHVQQDLLTFQSTCVQPPLSGVPVTRSLVLCVIFCISLFVSLSFFVIGMSVPLWFRAPDHHFGVFKLFLHILCQLFWAFWHCRIQTIYVHCQKMWYNNVSIFLYYLKSVSFHFFVVQEIKYYKVSFFIFSCFPGDIVTFLCYL